MVNKDHGRSKNCACSSPLVPTTKQNSNESRSSIGTICADGWPKSDSLDRILGHSEQATPERRVGGAQVDWLAGCWLLYQTRQPEIRGAVAKYNISCSPVLLFYTNQASGSVWPLSVSELLLLFTNLPSLDNKLQATLQCIYAPAHSASFQFHHHFYKYCLLWRYTGPIITPHLSSYCMCQV